MIGCCNGSSGVVDTVCWSHAARCGCCEVERRVWCCRAGLKQPSVEVRFDDLCASAMGPEGAADGLFTVGVDLQVKALVCPPPHPRTPF